VHFCVVHYSCRNGGWVGNKGRNRLRWEDWRRKNHRQTVEWVHMPRAELGIPTFRMRTSCPAIKEPLSSFDFCLPTESSGMIYGPWYDMNRNSRTKSRLISQLTLGSSTYIPFSISVISMCFLGYILQSCTIGSAFHANEIANRPTARSIMQFHQNFGRCSLGWNRIYSGPRHISTLVQLILSYFCKRHRINPPYICKGTIVSPLSDGMGILSAYD
jgi:hypothetical protein